MRLDAREPSRRHRRWALLVVATWQWNCNERPAQTGGANAPTGLGEATVAVPTVTVPTVTGPTTHPTVTTAPVHQPGPSGSALTGAEQKLVDQAANATSWGIAARGVPFDTSGTPDSLEFFLRHADGQGETFVVHHCEAVFGAVDTRWRRTIVTEPKHVWASPAALSLDTKSLYTVAESCSAFEQPYHSDSVTVGLSVLSAVGLIVSCRVATLERLGGGYPAGLEIWRTYDARTSELASLDALVTADSVMAALLNDSYLKSHLEPRVLTALTAATSPADAVRLLEVETTMRFTDVGGYSFRQGRDTQGRVIMRVGLQTPASHSLPRLTVLGLWVEPKPEARAWFDAARTGVNGSLAPE